MLAIKNTRNLVFGIVINPQISRQIMTGNISQSMGPHIKGGCIDFAITVSNSAWKLNKESIHYFRWALK